jgi:hypothetical protein
MTDKPDDGTPRTQGRIGLVCARNLVNGAPEDVDFSTEIEAIEWIRDKSSAWLATRSA